MIEDRNLTARMRDGVVLRADAYRPDAPDRVPAILVRTPYGKDGHRGSQFMTAAVERGYAVVVQDVRGDTRRTAISSEGIVQAQESPSQDR